MHITFLSVFSYLEKPKKSLWFLKDLIVKFFDDHLFFQIRNEFLYLCVSDLFLTGKKKDDIAIFVLFAT